DALVGRLEGRTAVFAHIMTARRYSEMYTISLAIDRMHAKPSIAGVPLARVLVVADSEHHLPRIAAVTAAKERGRFDAAPEVLLVIAWFERPDVGEGTAVLFREGGR